MSHAHFLRRTPAALIAIVILAMTSPQSLGDAQQDEEWHLDRSTADRVYVMPAAGSTPLVFPANIHAPGLDGRNPPQSGIRASRGVESRPLASDVSAHEPQEDKTEDADFNRGIRIVLGIALGFIGCLLVGLAAFAVLALRSAVRN